MFLIGLIDKLITHGYGNSVKKLYRRMQKRKKKWGFFYLSNVELVEGKVIVWFLRPTSYHISRMISDYLEATVLMRLKLFGIN